MDGEIKEGERGAMPAKISVIFASANLNDKKDRCTMSENKASSANELMIFERRKNEESF